MVKASELEKLGWKSLRQLGEGGQAEVHLVHRIGDPAGQKYALKYLSSRGNEKATARFRNEMVAINKLDHSGIAKIIDSSKDDGPQYYVMEYVEGAKSLRHRMKDGSNPFHCNPLGAIDGFRQIAAVLEVCGQQSIVHRDLSPANVLVTDMGRIILIDFGLCFIENGDRLTVMDEAVGTPHYRAPECSGHSQDPIKIQADLYSAGKILWSMITNLEAFDREEPVFNRLSLNKMLPELPMAWHLHHVFESSIRKDFCDRFLDAGAGSFRGRFVQDLIRRNRSPLEEIAKGVCS